MILATYEDHNPSWFVPDKCPVNVEMVKIINLQKFDLLAFNPSIVSSQRMSRKSMTFSCLNLVKIFTSRKVLWQNVWCSNGVIFLIATLSLLTES